MEIKNQSCTLEPGEYKELVKLCFETQKLSNSAFSLLLGIGFDVTGGVMEKILEFPFNTLEQIIPADSMDDDDFRLDFIDMSDFDEFWIKYFEKEI